MMPSVWKMISNFFTFSFLLNTVHRNSLKQTSFIMLISKASYQWSFIFQIKLDHYHILHIQSDIINSFLHRYHYLILLKAFNATYARHKQWRHNWPYFSIVQRSAPSNDLNGKIASIQTLLRLFTSCLQKK